MFTSIFGPEIAGIINELVDEGLLTLQNEGMFDGWAYLTEAPFAPESSTNFIGLHCMRRYLNIPEDLEMFKIDDETYNTWYEEHKDNLPQIGLMKTYAELTSDVEVEPVVLTDEDKEWLDQYSVEDGSVSDNIEKFGKVMNSLKPLVELLSDNPGDGRYEEYSKELTHCERCLSFLYQQDKLATFSEII